MKRKILLSLVLLLGTFSVGGILSALYVTRATEDLQGLLTLHKIENLRRSLVIDVQSVQSDLYTIRTPLSRDLDAIVARVLHLDREARECRSCHHPPELTRRLEELGSLIGGYQEALSRYITARANRDRIESIQLEAAAIGDRILLHTEQMSLVATRKLDASTRGARARIQSVRAILLLTGVVSLLLASLAGAHLIRSVTRPVERLVEATRRLARGELGLTLEGEDRSEFGELARHFNAMSGALRDSYDRLQESNAELEAEIAERRRAEEALRLDEVRLKALLDLSRMKDASPEEIAEFVLDRALVLTQSEVGFVALSEDGEVFTQIAVSSPGGERTPTNNPPAQLRLAEAGLWAEAVRRKEPVAINDYASTRLESKSLPGGHVPVRRLLTIPVHEEERTLGVCVVANKQAEYGDTDIQQLTLLLHGMWQHVKRRKSEEGLLRAQKLESIGLLAGGIAHDFNNLLTGILANVTLAETELGDNGRLRKRLREVEKASLRAKGLTQQLLTFSKGGAPVTEAADVGELVMEAATFALSGASVGYEFRCEEDLWPAAVDPAQFEQVISNLVINAEQAMPDRGRISIACDNVEVGTGEVSDLPAGRYVRVEIADEGSGIPHADLHRIFDPYFSTKPTGTGLGLATVHSIVRRHGGHITVGSELGAGSTFRVYLPACAGVDGGLPGPAIEEAGERGQNGSEVRRVLLLDDDELIRDVATEALTDAGFEVQSAAEGRTAVELYREARDAGTPFDAVVMDLTIAGGMGGLEALQKIRRFDPRVRAIVSSGYSNDPAMADPESYGFCGRISKPYRIRELLSALEGVMA